MNTHKLLTYALNSVRYRDIQPVKFSAFEEIFKLLGRFFKQLVFVIGQHGMYLRRVAVAELFA